MLFKSILNTLGPPNKNSCIPQIRSAAEIFLCFFENRLFLETFHLTNAINTRFLEIDTAITRICSCWTDAQHHQCAVCCVIIQSLSNFIQKFSLLQNQMIRWCHHYISIQILFQNFVGGIGDTRCRVITVRF